MQEYKIIEVSDDEPKEWFNPKTNDKVYYINVVVEGHDKPISVGKLDPNALKEGDTIYGEIIETDYLNDRFKAAKKPFSGSGVPTNDNTADNIHRSVALQQAIASVVPAGNIESTRIILERADRFYDWLIKKPTEPKKVTTTNKKQIDKLVEDPNDEWRQEQEVEEEMSSEHGINVEDIPF